MYTPLLAAAALLLVPAARAALVTIDNVHPRLDTEGRIVDAHDGSLLIDPRSGRYFLYGTHYQSCPLVPPPPSPGDCVNRTCGWYGNTFAAYSSPDLTSGSWLLESTSIAPGMEANNTVITYFMPNVLYNALTGRYVLAYNVVGSAQVAVSAAAAGPFTILGDLALHLPPASQLDLWLDPLDGAAYVRYNNGGQQCLERLAPDFTSSTGNYTCFDSGVGFLEGGGVWRRGDRVYVQGGHGCCFCPSGGSSLTFVSSTGPLGSYSFIGDANPQVPCNSSDKARAIAGKARAVAAAAAPVADPCTDLSGDWLGFFTPACPTDGDVVIRVNMTSATTFVAMDDQWDSPGNGTLNGTAVAFTGHWGGTTAQVLGELRSGSAGAACGEVAWVSPGHTSERWCREGACRTGGLAVVAQQFQTFEIPLAGGAGSAFVYFGERWGSAPTGRKSDDFSAWVPYAFNADGSVVPMTHLPDSFTLDLP